MWSKSTFALDFVVGFEDTYVDAWLYSDHQRYFFFQVGDIGEISGRCRGDMGRYSATSSSRWVGARSS